MDNDNNEKISIITAVYNSDKFIEETIISVLGQTYSNWKWYIIDDCSTDETFNMISKFKDNRIEYIKLDNNVGAARARNVGLKHVKTKYVAFIDADDTWNKNKLETQLRFMKDNNYAFTFTSYQIIGKKKPVKIPDKLNYREYMKNTIIGMLTVMIDCSQINNLEFVDVKKDHDSMTWAKILKKGVTAYGLNESLSQYRKVSGSISNNKFEAVKNHWNNCRQIEKLGKIETSYYFFFYMINAIKKHFL